MNEILGEGLALMCIGMGTVLIFLCIMIAAMNVMSKAVAKLNTIFPEPIIQPASSGRKSVSSGDDSEIAAAIAAAMFKG